MCAYILGCWILFSALACAHKFPEQFKRCHLSDPELDSCLNNAVENGMKLIGSTGEYPYQFLDQLAKEKNNITFCV
ncbi:hypothetical protein JTB14_031282 [Gonioctena quinquepunctata]|nr:hypothetical protein JTB14_031282 [Gonioctena quinquepunctata]